MRSDVTGYIVAAFYFVLAIASSFIFTELNSIFWISFSTILGIIFIIAGYSQRPKTKKPIKTLPPQITPEESTTPNSEETITQQTPIEAEEAEVSIEESTIAEAVPVEALQTETDAATEETNNLTEEQTLPQQDQEHTTITTPDNNKDKTIPTQTQTNETPLTNVEGIGEKRAAKLNELGIHTIKELSQITIEDLAKDLNIPHKTATKLIEAAKQQLQQQ